jgi:hypothetical protein
MTLTIDFTTEQIRGITAAREDHNANPPSESDAPFATNEEYIAWVIGKASDSYASQYPA